MASGGYIESAIQSELDELANCPPGSQDTTMNKVAFALARMVNGGWAPEAEIEARFYAACDSLDCPDDPWTRTQQRQKWVRAKKEAPPREAPPKSREETARPFLRKNGQAGSHNTSPKQKPAPKAELSAVPFPNWTPPGEEGGPIFESAALPPKQRGEKRRHIYFRDGHAVRAKIKYERGNAASWVDLYRVSHPRKGLGWQAKKPHGYIECPYFLNEGLNPFDPELLGETLYLTEGEKDADTLARLNFCAVSFGGSSSNVDCRDIISEGLEGTRRHIVILGDNDDAGRKWAHKQASLMLAYAASIKVYTFPELPVNGDVSDYFETHTREDFERLVASLPIMLPGLEFDPVLVSGAIVTPPRYIIKRVLPAEGLIVFAGQSEAGKTYAAVKAAVAAASGTDFLGFPVKERACVIYAAAEGSGTIDNRFAVAMKAAGVEGELPILVLKKPGNIKDEFEAFKVSLASMANWLKTKWQLEHCAFFLDTRAAAWPIEDENDSAEAALVCSELRSIGPIVGGPVVFTNHYGKDQGRGLRGASGWGDNCDQVIAITVSDDEGEKKREIGISRSRFAPTQGIGELHLHYEKLGIDRYGDEFGDCWIEATIVAGKTQNTVNKMNKSGRPNQRDRVFADAVNNTLLELGQKRASHNSTLVLMAKVADIRADFFKRYATGEEGDAGQGAARMAWKRCFETLNRSQYDTIKDSYNEWLWRKM